MRSKVVALLVALHLPALADVDIELSDGNPELSEFVLIPAGSFEMGDRVGSIVGGDTVLGHDLPVHTVYVSAFFMARHEVTKALWDEVRSWALGNGYPDLPIGSYVGDTSYSKGPSHPVHWISWREMIKWCNARSEKEGLSPCYRVGGAVYRTGGSDAVTCDWNANGYRLPSEAEWEKAARGGLSGKRFPWGDTISHSQANYQSNTDQSYDISPTRDHHPAYNDGSKPYTSPAGSFPPNGYGLYDMAGNVAEWCWDWFKGDYYRNSSGTDPHGPATGSRRVWRGGHYTGSAIGLRCAARHDSYPFNRNLFMGFRLALSAPPNEPPTANAGIDQTVHVGTLVELDGSQSSDHNTEVSQLLYEWSVISAPSGSLATLSDPNSSAPTLTPDLAGEFVVQLIVTDEGGLASTADQVTVTSLEQAPLLLNAQTGLYDQEYRLFNPFGTAQTGLRLYVRDLPDGITLHNAHGVVDGVPYVQHNGMLAPGDPVVLQLEYLDLSRSADFEPSFEIVSSDGQSFDPGAGSATPLAVRLTMQDGEPLLEFRGVKDRTYHIQYSADLQDWITVLPPLIGTGTSQQWIDSGPPKTEAHPAQVPTRHYRLFEAQQ